MTDSKSEALLRAGCGSCSYNDRSIILIGGKRDNVCFKDCWMYDVSSQLLELLSEGPTEFSGRHHHSVTLVHDTVWVIGGINVSDVLGDCWCFHVSSRKWNKPELTYVSSTRLVGCLNVLVLMIRSRFLVWCSYVITSKIYGILRVHIH